MKNLNRISVGGMAVGTTLTLVLSACSPMQKDVTGEYASKPDSLKDCTFSELRNADARVITVVRCPNSQTSTTGHDKHPSSTAVIEDSITVNGVEYTKKQ